MLVLLKTLFAGFVATLVMSLLMTFVHRARWANADMIRAVGSFFTRSHENALLVGLVIHFASGLGFAIPYTIVLGGIGSYSAWVTLGLGLMIGFLHGFVMSFIMLAVASTKHPLEQFQKPDFDVAVVHVLGHVAYGACIGALVGLLSIDWGLRL